MLILLLLSGCTEKKAAESLKPDDHVVDQQRRSEAHVEKAPTPSSNGAPQNETKNVVPDIAAPPDGTDKSYATVGSPALAVTTADRLTAESPNSTRKSASSPRPFDEVAWLPDALVGLIVIHPQQFFNSPLGQLLSEFAIDKQPSRWTITFQKANLQLAMIERITVALDQPFVNSMAKELGVRVPDIQQERPRPRAQLMAMKAIGLGFHNYHDVFSKFPRADGDGDGKRTGLSWRVHILPFVEQAALYDEFHLDEAWDSDHNRTLIAKMPDIFKSPDVKDRGKTSFHVFTGEKTPFYGNEGYSLGKMTDGTSNTILVALAGADTAEIWTKPGGLEVDLTAPKKCLGTLAGGTFLALKADGAVFNVPSTTDDLTLSRMIQPADGSSLDVEQVRGENPSSTPPTLIIRLSSVANQAEIVSGLLSQPSTLMFEEQTIHHNDRLAVWFPQDQTIALGTIESVKSMISASRSQSRPTPFIEKLRLDSDLTAVIDLESQSTFVREIAKLNPMLGVINNIDKIAIHVAMSLENSQPLFDMDLKAHDAQMAMGLSAMMDLGLNQLRQTYEKHPLPPTANESDQEMRSLINRLLASTNIVLDESQIQVRATAPEGLDRLPLLLRSTLAAGIEASRGSEQKLALRQLGIAFHNFHSAHNFFPGAGRGHPNRPVGLSWRVHLLPYLDQAGLYNEFKLDEPWDSEHNKKLINKMPMIYRSPGVDDPGKTSLHVFVGPQTAFADDKTPKVVDISDGTSNTILVVQAGSDTAEVWTKPGGLIFDPDNPARPLGDVVKDSFIALFFSGDVKQIEKDVKPEKLRRMILHNDGNPLE
ncbi:DUF1559 family PulG-like putative transporter [Schlesneria paludicola]|uniref:DUF1559 family PulG-like putative transporter n=1 Tax=Schlesneria paludicola TaxID=360056 RepID=UPI00187269AF|nr:DUF1559 domain-containing protein [Schlesneria paludicola]